MLFHYLCSSEYWNEIFTRNGEISNICSGGPGNSLVFGISTPVSNPPKRIIESRSLLTRKLMFTECFTVTPIANTANMTRTITEVSPIPSTNLAPTPEITVAIMNTIATEAPPTPELSDEQRVELEELIARNMV